MPSIARTSHRPAHRGAQVGICAASYSVSLDTAVDDAGMHSKKSRPLNRGKHRGLAACELSGSVCLPACRWCAVRSGRYDRLGFLGINRTIGPGASRGLSFALDTPKPRHLRTRVHVRSRARHTPGAPPGGAARGSDAHASAPSGCPTWRPHRHAPLIPHSGVLTCPRWRLLAPRAEDRGAFSMPRSHYVAKTVRSTSKRPLFAQNAMPDLRPYSRGFSGSFRAMW